METPGEPRFVFKCIGGPKDGTDFVMTEENYPTNFWDMVTLVQEQGLHAGFDTNGNDFSGWYFYEKPDRLVYRELSEEGPEED